MTRYATTLLIIAAMGLGPALADDAPAPPPERQSRPDQAPDSPDRQPEALPSLEELLGLPSEPRDDDEEDRPPRETDPDRARLDRALTATEAAEMFAQAIQQMSDVADLLQIARDTGISTQRVQEEILRKLEVLIEQSQQQSGGSSSSGRPQQQQQQQQQAQSQPQAGEQDQAASGEGAEQTPPARRDGPLGELFDAASAAWGSLPPRMRDTLIQGTSDRFSSLYQSMTEEYYRRLAEEAGRD